MPIHPLPLWHCRYRSVDSNSRSRTSPSGAWEQNYETGLSWVNNCRKPSPNHHHFYRWYHMDLYVYHSQSRMVYGIVLPTLFSKMTIPFERSLRRLPIIFLALNFLETDQPTEAHGSQATSNPAASCSPGKTIPKQVEKICRTLIGFVYGNNCRKPPRF